MPVVLHAFLSSVDFFLNQLFQNILLGIPSECLTVWIQIRPDVSSGLILIQTVCKIYQQTTKVATSGERVNVCHVLFKLLGEIGRLCSVIVHHFYLDIHCFIHNFRKE